MSTRKRFDSCFSVKPFRQLIVVDLIVTFEEWVLTVKVWASYSTKQWYTNQIAIHCCLHTLTLCNNCLSRLVLRITASFFIFVFEKYFSATASCNTTCQRYWQCIFWQGKVGHLRSSISVVADAEMTYRVFKKHGKTEEWSKQGDSLQFFATCIRQRFGEPWR